MAEDEGGCRISQARTHGKNDASLIANPRAFWANGFQVTKNQIQLLVTNVRFWSNLVNNQPIEGLNMRFECNFVRKVLEK